MANIDITDQGSTLNNGVLQLENGVAMDTTLRYVADQLNTKSQLLLATNATTIEGTLKIKTANVEYLDVEDTLGNNRFTISKAVGSQKVDLDFASNPTSPTDIVGGIRTFQDGVNLSDSLFFRKNGQATFTERVNVEGDSSVTTQTSSVIRSTTTNANLVIAPNGTGALVASIPDGTATGGNARGTNAVDLQTSRTTNTQVASGNYSIITGGASNTANVIFSAILGGNGNTASTGQYATVIGGVSNTSSGFATLAHGNQNTASGGIALGTSNTASGAGSLAVGGTNTASGNQSFAVGNTNRATNTYSIAMGAFTRSYMQGQLCVSGFSLQGTSSQDAQSTIFTLGVKSVLNSGATATLSCDGTGTTNLLIPYVGPGSSNGRSWNVTIKYVAVVTAITGTATGVTVGDTKSQNIEIGFKRIGVTSSLVGAGSYSIAQEDASMNTATLIPTAGGSQQLALTFTAPTFAGGGSVTCNVVAQVQVAETGW